MHVQNLRYPLPLKISGPKPPIFDVSRQLRNLRANLTANIFGTKHDINNREGRWKLQRIPCTVPEFMSFGLQTACVRTVILPALRKFCILLHCQASHTEFNERNSSKLHQTVESKSRKLLLKISGYSSRKIGAKSIYFGSFLTTSRLIGEYLRTETCYRQQETTRFGNYEGSPAVSKKFMNFGRQTAKNRTFIFIRPP